MGFSAALFSPDYWYLEDGTDKGAKPLQYEFEVFREPGIPVEEYGHVSPSTIRRPSWGGIHASLPAQAQRVPQN